MQGKLETGRTDHRCKSRGMMGSPHSPGNPGSFRKCTKGSLHISGNRGTQRLGNSELVPAWGSQLGSVLDFVLEFVLEHGSGFG
jgi:hypothetical protein